MVNIQQRTWTSRRYQVNQEIIYMSEML